MSLHKKVVHMIVIYKKYRIMNIIKFKDVIKPDDNVFNDKYKGKYCWWVNCKWAVAFDDMDPDLYVEASRLNEIPTGVGYLDTEEYSSFVDIMATERINNQINVCQIINDNVGEIPLDNLKRFRTWLAESLIKLTEDVYDNETDSSGYDYETDTMLKYYANNMEDATIMALTHFASIPRPTDVKSACKCNQTSIKIGLATLGTQNCDPISLYRDAIYGKMMEVFSNIDFWTSKVEFCELIIRYIDGILNAGLPLKSRLDLNNLDYCDCTCVNADDTALRSILLQLKQAYQYIINGTAYSHKNFIYTALHNWASKLYETMYWV